MIRLPEGVIIGTKCIALSPHIDDVAFSLGAALLNNRFRNMILITVFSISNCTVSDDNFDSTRISEIRAREDQAFFDFIGTKIKRVYLDRLDAPLRLNISDSSVFTTVFPKSDNKEIALIIECTEKLLSSNALLLAPLGLGNHIDHLIVHSAACLLMDAGFPVAFYEELPYAGRMNLSEIENRVKMLQGTRNIKLVDCLLQSKFNIAMKIKGISVYRSQIDKDTIKCIVKHNKKFSNKYVVERLWCSEKAAEIIQYYISNPKC